MKKIISLLSIFVTFVFVLIGVASCGSSSQVEIGMDKNKLLNEIYKSDSPAYNIDNSYYWYDDNFYNLFEKYSINIKESSDKLTDIQDAIKYNSDLRNELNQLHFRYRFAKFDDDDKLIEFYYDFDHKFSLEDDYANFGAKSIKNFNFSKSKLEYYIEEREQFKNNKNKLSVYAKLIDYDNINYTVDFEDGSLFKARLKDTVSNSQIEGEVNTKSKKIKLYFDVESYLANDLLDYYDVISKKYKDFDYSHLVGQSAFKKMNIEYSTDFIESYSKLMTSIKLVGYITADGHVEEWKTKPEYLPDYANSEIGELKETTYNGVIYEGYTLNPYYKVKGVANKNNYELSIHDDAQIIETGALCNLPNLYYLELPSNICEIEDDAIVNNPNLLGVYIPESVETIGNNNFSGSPKLIEIVNKSSTYNKDIAISALGNTAFYYNRTDTYTGHGDFIFKVDSGTSRFIFAKFESTKEHPIIYDGYYLMGILSTPTNKNLELPESFYYNGKKITGYKIFKTAFAYNTEIKNVTIPNSIKYLGEGAFYGCTSLESVVADGIVSVGSQAFGNCSKLANVSMNGNFELLDNSVFENCTSLETITLPNISYIPYNMFNGCTSLVTVNTPNVTSVWYGAFSNCINLETFINKCLDTIEGEAFYNCKKLTSINISDYISSIDATAFIGCDSLVPVEYNNMIFLPSENYQYRYLYKIKSKTVTSLEIPEETMYVNTTAFDGYSSLTDLTVNNNISFYQLKEILGYCTNLNYSTSNNGYYIGSASNQYLCLVGVVDKNATSFEFNSNTVFIYNKAFENTKLNIVAIPDTIYGIGDEAFRNSKLTEVIVPNNVSDIGSYLFADCKELTQATVYCGNADNMFDGCTALKSVILNDTYIRYSLFNNCTSLTVVDLGTGHISNVDGYGFAGCSSLEIIDLSQADGIYDYAFTGCSSLETINISNVRYIGSYAFYNCTSLASVTFGINSDVTNILDYTIGSYAFAGCSNLETLSIPNGYTNFGESLFTNCSKLISVMIPYGEYKNFNNIFVGANIQTIYFRGTVKDLEDAGFKLSMLEINQNIYVYLPAGTTKPNINYKYWTYDSDNNIVIVP